jgi:sugar lactone lactonase YvrE
MKTKMFLRLFLTAAALAAPSIPVSIPATAGDLYVTDFGSGSILKFTPAGAQSTFAIGLNSPKGLAFDRSGNLFVTDTFVGIIYKFTPDGTQSVFASGLSFPIGLAFDGTGNLFVSESMGDIGTISKFTPAGTKSTFASGGNFPWLAFDSVGNLFAATGGPTDADGGIIWFTPDRRVHTFSFTGGAGMAFDAARNFFVTDFGGILKYTPAGDQSIFTSKVDLPNGLAFDGTGNLFVADDGSGTILKFRPDGIKSTFASGLNEPLFIAFEPVTEKLRNISARGFVQTGENVLIAGLIVGGNALANNAVVLRAIGPSLASSAIANPLQDPILELHNSSGALIASNNNWQDTQKAQIMATGLAPADTHESAIYATLSAGAYTAIVRSANGATGVALVEVYNLSK